jgi:predicted nucleic-acid-binding protein
MTGIDTNVLIRLITQDDPKQYTLALKLVNRDLCHVPLTVALEAEWVLRSVAKLSAQTIAEAYRSLMETENISFANEAVLLRAISAYELGMDFADALHAAQVKNNDTFATLDKDFAKRAPKAGFEHVYLLK